MERTEQLRMREVHLALALTTDAICGLELGDTVFLSGVLFTGREGFYQRVFEQKLEPPLDRGSLPDRLSPTRGYLFDHRRLRPGGHLRAGDSSG